MGMENMGSREGMEPAAHQMPGAASAGGTGAAGDGSGANGAEGADATDVPDKADVPDVPGGSRAIDEGGEPKGPGEPNEPDGPREPGEPSGAGGHDGPREPNGADGEGESEDAGGGEGRGGSGSAGAGGGESGSGSAGCGAGEGGGIAALSLPARIFVAIAVAVVAVAVAFHVAMVFLQTAPDNTVSKQHADVIDAYVYPEFERNWKLFAPNPLQQNIAVHARATVAKDDGGTETTGWVNLTAMDGEAIRGNPAPSHTQQNELRRGWEFYTSYHDDKARPIGMRGQLSEQYIKRIVMLRFGPELNGGSVERIQLRSATTPVKAPEWSQERTDVKTEYRVQPWWQVTSADLPGGGK